MLVLTDQEKQMVKNFITTSLSNVTDTALVDTFVALLDGDDVTRKTIANQVALYMQGQVDALNNAIANSDIEKDARNVFLSNEATKFSDLKTKLDNA